MCKHLHIKFHKQTLCPFKLNGLKIRGSGSHTCINCLCNDIAEIYIYLMFLRVPRALPKSAPSPVLCSIQTAAIVELLSGTHQQESPNRCFAFLYRSHRQILNTLQIVPSLGYISNIITHLTNRKRVQENLGISLKVFILSASKSCLFFAGYCARELTHLL